MNTYTRILAAAGLTMAASTAEAQVKSGGALTAKGQYSTEAVPRGRVNQGTTLQIGNNKIAHTLLYDAEFRAADNGFGTTFLTYANGAGGIGVGAFKPGSKRHIKAGAALDVKLALPWTDAKATALIPFNKETGNVFVNTKTKRGSYEARLFGNYDMQKGLVASEVELSRAVLGFRLGVQANAWGTIGKRNYSVNLTRPYTLK